MSAPKTPPSKASSSSYAVSIPLNESVHRRLILAWAALALTGLLLILNSGLPLWLLVMSAFGWISVALLELPMAIKRASSRWVNEVVWRVCGSGRIVWWLWCAWLWSTFGR